MATPAHLQRKQIDGHRWFQLWIGLGLGLAILLLVSSISTYVLVSRRLIVEHLRSDLASQVAIMSQQVQRGAVKSSGQVAAMLQQAQARSDDRIAWIQIRNGDGSSISESGSAATPAFSNPYVRSHISARQPIFKVVNGAAGQVLVEVFPFRLPDGWPAGKYP